MHVILKVNGGPFRNRTGDNPDFQSGALPSELKSHIFFVNVKEQLEQLMVPPPGVEPSSRDFQSRAITQLAQAAL